MIKEMAVYTAARFPKYDKAVYRNISRDQAVSICERMQQDLDAHRIEDYQIEISE